ncbi:MAG: NADH-quinone oxidoreductase subunit J [Actinobacteria bacterium]|nr:NADH-quinone oxidoreductase subunit J [Actinomycetota bacterium]
MHQYVFVVIGVLMAIAAVRLVTTKNVVHGALYLLMVLAGAAAIFILLLAEFVGWVQVLLYIGAVVVLLLFGLMLTRAPIGRTALDNQSRALAALVAGAIFAMTSMVLVRAFDGQMIDFSQTLTVRTLGGVLFTKYVLPFEVVSVLLLAALVGAVVLAKRDE